MPKELTEKLKTAITYLQKHIDFFAAPFVYPVKFQQWAYIHETKIRKLSDSLHVATGNTYNKLCTYRDALIGTNAIEGLSKGNKQPIRNFLKLHPLLIGLLCFCSENPPPVIKLWEKELTKIEKSQQANTRSKVLTREQKQRYREQIDKITTGLRMLTDNIAANKIIIMQLRKAGQDNFADSLENLTTALEQIINRYKSKLAKKIVGEHVTSTDKFRAECNSQIGIVTPKLENNVQVFALLNPIKTSIKYISDACIPNGVQRQSGQRKVQGQPPSRPQPGTPIPESYGQYMGKDTSDGSNGRQELGRRYRSKSFGKRYGPLECSVPSSATSRVATNGGGANTASKVVMPLPEGPGLQVVPVGASMQSAQPSYLSPEARKYMQGLDPAVAKQLLQRGGSMETAFAYTLPRPRK